MQDRFLCDRFRGAKGSQGHGQQEKTGADRTEQERLEQDWTGWDKTGHNRTGLKWAGQVRTAGRLSLPVTMTEEGLFTGGVATLDITGPKRIPQSDAALFFSRALGISVNTSRQK